MRTRSGPRRLLALRGPNSEIDIERGERLADYFAMQRWSDFYEPDLDELEAITRGYEPVWEDETWILWDMHP